MSEKIAQIRDMENKKGTWPGSMTPAASLPRKPLAELAGIRTRLLALATFLLYHTSSWSYSKSTGEYVMCVLSSKNTKVLNDV